MEEWSGFGFLNGILLTTAVSLFVLYRLRRRRLLELAEKIPGPPGLPVIGNALDFIGSSHNVFTNIYSKGNTFGDLAKFWIGSRLLVFLCHPADVELILSSHEHIDKSPEYKYFEPWLGSGLLISSGEMWKAHRKVIAPTFHLNILKSFFPQFNKNSRQTVEKLKEKVGKAEFDCHDVMSEATVEILLETVMGVNKSTQDSGFDYAMAVMKMCDILHLRHTKFYLRSEILFYLSKYRRAQDKFLNTIHSLTRKVFKIRKEEYIKNGRTLPGNAMHEPVPAPTPAPSKNTEKPSADKTQNEFSFGMTKGMKDDLDEDIGEKKRLAFLDYLIDSSENGVMLNDLEIQNQIDTIMFEGHDTTAAASSFFLCMMATRQDIQEKVYEELHKIFGDSDRDVTFQDTLEMKYLERCLMETMRMYPPVPIIARELQKEVKLASRPDLTIPANVTVIIATVRLHRRPDVFPNPDHFDPDNFLPERSASRHYYSFIPFSAGPRSCVGRKYAMLKLKVLLANVLRNFKVVGGKPEKEWKLQADIILKRSDGFGVRLEPRKK